MSGGPGARKRRVQDCELAVQSGAVVLLRSRAPRKCPLPSPHASIFQSLPGRQGENIRWRGLCRMQEIPTETAESIAAARSGNPATAISARVPAVAAAGNGGRLALVRGCLRSIVWGHVLATRTTRIAVSREEHADEHEPRRREPARSWSPS